MSFSKETQDVRYLKFGDVCKIRSGTRFYPQFQTNSGFPIVRVKNIRDGQITTEGLSYCDPKNHNSAIIRQGDIVMARAGRTGVVGINLTGREFFFNENVFKLVPNRRFVTSRYLYLFLSRHQDIKTKLKG
ncbi:type I restriction-modification system, S subunit (fragment) [Mycoplasma haemofelis str. Langford 1]|uniref:Type I restriction enzyme specificity HsdS domain protein n=2 Tax=Mycoplasma haemofelis TaxID=29501 RepID=F6FIJ8_MYCHI